MGTTAKAAKSTTTTTATTDHETATPQEDQKAEPESEKKTKPKAKGTGSKKQELGKLGEDLACHYLTDNGVDILERNWKCKSGEADIIANEDDTLVFIEVKTRGEGFPGLPEYAVTQQKRTRYEKIATSYLVQNQRPSGRVRFDVVAIQMTGEKQCLLRHHRDAFAADA